MTIDEMLSMLEIKMNERFPSLTQAFRAFDFNNNGSLSLNEFSLGVETYLKIKLN
jgi:Ca2+-binding EF-hand superfamily protein